MLKCLRGIVTRTCTACYSVVLLQTLFHLNSIDLAGFGLRECHFLVHVLRQGHWSGTLGTLSSQMRANFKHLHGHESLKLHARSLRNRFTYLLAQQFLIVRGLGDCLLVTQVLFGPARRILISKHVIDVREVQHLIRIQLRLVGDHSL